MENSGLSDSEKMAQYLEEEAPHAGGESAAAEEAAAGDGAEGSPVPAALRERVQPGNG